jgi:hypothetical protein
LGSKIVTNGSVKEEITERLKMQKKSYQLVREILWKWEMPKKGKICVFKIYCMPILMYGAVTWTGTKEDVSRLTAAEMRF